MTKLVAAGSLLMMTMSCAAVPPETNQEAEVPVHGSSGRVCNAAKAQSLVGRPASSEIGAEALRLSGAGLLRWLRPGDIVTMEYREDRLNVEIDANNRVRAIRCG